jgi:hypothetical protein
MLVGCIDVEIQTFDPRKDRAGACRIRNVTLALVFDFGRRNVSSQLRNLEDRKIGG